MEQAEHWSQPFLPSGAKQPNLLGQIAADSGITNFLSPKWRNKIFEAGAEHRNGANRNWASRIDKTAKNGTSEQNFGENITSEPRSERFYLFRTEQHNFEARAEE